MKADFFIDRPVFSTVLSIIIVIVGAIGLALLPVDQYPQIVPPVVRVSASYPGADAHDRDTGRCYPHRAGAERYARHDLYGVVELQLGRFLRDRHLRYFGRSRSGGPWMSRTA